MEKKRIQGDINNDGLVNDVDVWLLSQIIADKFHLNRGEIRETGITDGRKPKMQDLVDLQRKIARTLPGDVTGDGVIDEEDARVLKKEILKLLRLDQYAKEGDGQMCAGDFALLQKLIEGIIASYEANKPKHNTVTIRLDEFETGEYLSWFVTTQAAYKVTVTLKDDKNVYFSEDKESIAIKPPLSVGSEVYAGKNLVLEVSIPQSEDVRVLPSMNTMITDTGKILGHALTCCGEDWTDNDYNDFYINLVGWKSKK